MVGDTRPTAPPTTVKAVAKDIEDGDTFWRYCHHLNMAGMGSVCLCIHLCIRACKHVIRLEGRGVGEGGGEGTVCEYIYMCVYTCMYVLRLE